MVLMPYYYQKYFQEEKSKQSIFQTIMNLEILMREKFFHDFIKKERIFVKLII